VRNRRLKARRKSTRDDMLLVHLDLDAAVRAVA
jgi:hypothetical protein